MFDTNAVAKLTQPYVNPGCAASFPPEEQYHCGTMSVLYSHIRTPLFVLENQFDSNQIKTQMQCPPPFNASKKAYIRYYGINMNNSVQQTKGVAQNGMYFASCFSHGTSLKFGSHTKVQGATTVQAVGNWYFNRTTTHMYFDDCASSDGLPCNPTCDGVQAQVDMKDGLAELADKFV
eukprot:TRINITY_DN12195_c0_g1_i1.p2 TRINITY_DN12195_c0_g1~~TRINITY_DN12195_c0_g1_i1.p2  ORF type:complete len:177 (+),score=56.54 TRINITY_DN12195_c0_g1_i1:1008-1538(+)